MKRFGSMRFFLLALLLSALGPCLGWANPGARDQAPGREMAQQATKGAKRWITADHTKHEALKQPFASGPEVTKACLSCHSEAAAQFHKTIHWTWIDPAPPRINRPARAGSPSTTTVSACMATNRAALPVMPATAGRTIRSTSRT